MKPLIDAVAMLVRGNLKNQSIELYTTHKDTY